MSNETEPRRGPGRPSLRPSEPREETRVQPRLQRRHKADDDAYSIPAEFLAEGYDYNWKRVSTHGQPEDPWKLTKVYENHWEDVQAEELPGYVPNGHKGHIERGGLRLMKRPKYLSEDARNEELGKARTMSFNARMGLKTDVQQGARDLPVVGGGVTADINGRQVIPD